LVQKAVLCTGFVGLIAGSIWPLGNLVADITKGAVFVVFMFLIFIGTVLFSKKSEPADRLVRIIAAVRGCL